MLENRFAILLSQQTTKLVLGEHVFLDAIADDIRNALGDRVVG